MKKLDRLDGAITSSDQEDQCGFSGQAIHALWCGLPDPNLVFREDLKAELASSSILQIIPTSSSQLHADSTDLRKEDLARMNCSDELAGLAQRLWRPS